MNLVEAIAPYRDPLTGAVGLVAPAQPGRSCDNHILYSSTYVIRSGEDNEWFEKFALSCEVATGVLARYPGASDVTSYDDLLGASLASPFIARRIWLRGVNSDWDFVGAWLGRFVHFPPIIAASAGVPIGPFSELKIGMAFIQNCFEDRDNTSGRCMLILVARVLGDRFPLLKLIIAYWKLRMKRLYPEGERGVYETYFGTFHPFTVTAREDWE